MTENIFDVTPLGVITIDTDNIKEDITQNYKNTFGNTLNTDISTPQGQLINTDVAIAKETVNKVLDLANSFSPYYATGDSLDVVAGFFGYYRKIEVPTLVICTLTGIANTVISSGSLASDGTNEYKLLNTVVIGNDGKVENCQFECTVGGAITCLANSLNTIVTTITGWDTINNPTDGIVGYEKENDNIFRQRVTANYLNIRATGILEAIIDNIAQINGVMSVKGNENNKNISQVIDGITMISHSIYLSVLGGSDEEIAKVLIYKKTLGTSMNGDTIISYVDLNTQHLYNYLIYRPVDTPIQVEIEYQNNNSTPVNIEDLLKEQLIAYIQSNPFNIGQTISGNLLAQAFNNYNLCNILSLKLNLVGEVSNIDYLTFTNFQIPTLSLNNITTTLIS